MKIISRNVMIKSIRRSLLAVLVAVAVTIEKITEYTSNSIAVFMFAVSWFAIVEPVTDLFKHRAPGCVLSLIIILVGTTG